MIYAFFLGREQALSQAEILSVLARKKANIISSRQVKDVFFVELNFDLNCEEIMFELGGSVRIASHEEVITGKVVEDVAYFLKNIVTDGKIEFSLHADNARSLGIEIKKELKRLERGARYIEAKNTATILHNDLIKTGTDITIIGKDIFVTRAIQPIEDFSLRDYGKPSADAKSGMLPPKLARMMVNLSGLEHHKTLLDPFCGSGGVLIEAASLGFHNLIGSDFSKQAIADAQKNINWIKEKENLKSSVKFIEKRVENIGEFLPLESVDGIVTEPLMGKALKGRESEIDLKRQAEDLKRLYIDAFRNFKKVLKKNGSVIFIIPSFRYKDKIIKIDCVKEIENLGFKQKTFLSGNKTLTYARPDQHVVREIFWFEKV